MPGFQVVRSQEVGAVKLLDQFPCTVCYARRKHEVVQATLGVYLMTRT